MTITRDDPRFWDVRTLERRLRKGQITKKEYEKHVKALPDVEDKKAAISATDSLDDVDDDDFADADVDDDEEDDEVDDVAGGDSTAGGADGPDRDSQ